jgi:hypothetical protein
MTNNKQQTEINAVEYFSKVNQFAEENNTDNPKQQTAIEWLFDNVYMAHSELSEKLQQAKEMEKEQTIKTSLFWSHSTVKRKDIEDYYNETYGGGEQ